MPYLIDGNNLAYALASAGRDFGRLTLCELLACLDKTPARICVVFDGPAPPAQLARQIEQTGVVIRYSGSRKADDIIVELIAENSAPRRLVVVSTDREIRQAARRRRCVGVTSEDFASELSAIVERNTRRSQRSHDEPKEKHRGLSAKQSKYWLDQFKIDP